VTQQNLFEQPAPPKPPRRKAQPSDGPQRVRAQHNWFFALRPSVEDAARIHAQTQGLLDGAGIRAKRIAPERLHITLEFIGDEVDDEILERAYRAADMIRFPPIDAQFDAALTFSRSSGPLVLVGGAGLDAVRKLRSELACALADHGFKLPRNYEPHMTLCYDSRHRLRRTTIEPISFHTAEFALVKSHIGFSRHEVLRTWPLRTT
jgi:2''-5'' RNA ligase